MESESDSQSSSVTRALFNPPLPPLTAAERTRRAVRNGSSPAQVLLAQGGAKRWVKKRNAKACTAGRGGDESIVSSTIDAEKREAKELFRMIDGSGKGRLAHGQVS
jgi:hypothetical protein